jgi:hypothetical protein
MDAARSRVNDMMNSAEGDLLANDVPASQTYLTDAWDWLQARCETAGVQTFIRSVPIYGIPARATDDVANECHITWEGCSDGVNQYETPALPQDMISPKSIWRRPSSAGAPITVNTSNMELMEHATDGLPVVLDCNVVDWRDDGIYFYGANYAQDWKFRYSAYRPPLDITRPNDKVTIMMCEDCLGARIAFEFASARGSAQTSALEAWSESALLTIPKRATRIKMRQSIRRQPYSRGNNTNNRWYPNIPANS